MNTIITTEHEVEQRDRIEQEVAVPEAVLLDADRLIESDPNVEPDLTEGGTDADGADEEPEVEVDIAVERVDPNEVLIETNVRTTVALDEPFVRSIKRHGVIVPVVGYRNEDGQVVVRFGQRRILAAIKAGRVTVPAQLGNASDDPRIRIIHQMTENVHRASMTEADEAVALYDLTLDGLTPTRIAQELAFKPARVKTAVMVAGSEVAIKAVASQQLTLDQALVLAEFEDDPDALADLSETAERYPASFDHTAQRLRAQRERRQRYQAVVDEYTAQGITVTEEPVSYYSGTMYLDNLETGRGKELTVKNYRGKPGYAVTIEEDDEGNYEAIPVVIDWASHGLQVIGTAARESNAEAASGGDAAISEADTLAAVEAERERKRAERRELIANNRDWASAEVVRREWLANLVNRKSLPKNGAAFVATTLAGNTGQVIAALQDGNRLAHTFLGLERTYGQNKLVALVTEAPTKAATVSFTIAVAAIEDSITREAWRYPNERNKAYFATLRDWGYTLSDVENIVLGITPAKTEDTAEAEPEALTLDTNEANEVQAEAAEPDADNQGFEEGDRREADDAEADAVAEAEADALADAA
ncbi:MAG: ParB N-terminal domain-containing protein [Micrococcales bacterium]|nr:ParB N-terminal domain-containing protein [Micrococcales bacterium]OJX69406.1 MAG: hypothetical protein BGO94_12865 [Micrococcales bacterium 72-143]